MNSWRWPGYRSSAVPLRERIVADSVPCDRIREWIVASGGYAIGSAESRADLCCYGERRSHGRDIGRL